MGKKSLASKDNPSKFSTTNLLLLGGAVSSLTAYFAYQMFAQSSEESASVSEEDANLVSNFIIPTMASALVSIPAMFALALRDHSARGPVSFVVATQALGMMPTVDAKSLREKASKKLRRLGHSIDDKMHQNFDHWKQYRTPFDVLDAISDQVQKRIPKELKPILSGFQAGAKTDGTKSTVTVGHVSGPQMIIYETEKPKVPEVVAPSFSEFVEWGKQNPNYPKPEDDADDENHAAEKGMAKAIKACAARAIDRVAPAMKKPFSYAARGVSGFLHYNERLEDSQFDEAPIWERRTCAATGVAAETTGFLAVSSVTTAVTAGNVYAGVATACMAAETCDKIGDVAQELCHDGFDQTRKPPNIHRK